jgi:hypothetical protein
MNDNQYPLHPKLMEPAAQEAEALILMFKERMKKVADETLGEIYTEIVPFIESDSWGNFRNQLMTGLQGYHNRKLQGEYDFARIRGQIFSEYRNEIIKDLDQDNLKRIADLEKEVSRLREMLDSRSR